MGNKINDGNKDGILIQVRRSELKLDSPKIQEEILDFGEALYLNSPHDEVKDTHVAQAPRLVIGDANLTNTVPNEYGIRMVHPSIVDNSVYFNYAGSDTTKSKPHLVEADGQKVISNLRLSGDLYVNANDINSNGYKVARQDSIAPEVESKTYSEGDLVYKDNKLYYYSNGWKQTNLQEYINLFGGKIDVIKEVPGATKNLPESGQILTPSDKILTLTVPSKTSHILNDGDGNGNTYLTDVFYTMDGSQGTPDAKYRKCFWIDTQGGGKGGLKYYNGSSWVTVPVRWS